MRVFVLVPILAAAAFAQSLPPGFVGSEICQNCHAEVWENYHANPHYKLLASDSTPPEQAGCEGCHGPGGGHVRAGGGARTIPRAFSRLQPGQILDACLSCHARDFSRANIRRSSHTEADVVCTACHSIHSSPAPRHLLADAQEQLCYRCHGAVRAQFSMPFKHRVNEGFMTCSDCHNPHGADPPTWRMGNRPRMVAQHLGNEQPCLRCHADKRGPFTFEHPPLRVEGCEGCHSPHGSMNARLLRRPVVFTLCLECHTGNDSFGRQGDGVQRVSPSHNLFDPRYQQCTTCHVRIHGSNADPRFLR
ncbi:MAG: DmsE family decaheme c-type cytochrome [Bryobacterales bacterium]|nr:DmsE family decaheme c-type cytochrome [Bryobacterales bacterium]